MGHNEAANTKLVTPEPLLLGEIHFRFLWVSGHNIFIKRSVRNFVLWLFLLKESHIKYKFFHVPY